MRIQIQDPGIFLTLDRDPGWKNSDPETSQSATLQKNVIISLIAPQQKYVFYL
jgi:hypothetical protein